MLSIRTIQNALDRFAPPHTAADWDNVGLLVGDPDAPCERIMTCLTLTDDVAGDAIREGCHLIVSHHPLPFKPLKSLTTKTADGRILLPLIRAGVAVYSPHTAFDNCPGGINDGLASRLGLVNVRSLRTVPSGGQYKLTVFVPEADYERVADAVFAAGAGRIGIEDKYTECGFRIPGIGTFHGGESANPTVGQKGRREAVTELRFETVVPQTKLTAVVRAMIAAHSYEEPAYDLYPVSVFPHWGQGRIGELTEAIALSELVSRVTQQLNTTSVQIVGEVSQSIRRVAVACGAAGEYLADAIQQQADCFLTGELRFHDALTARSSGIACVIPGHYSTERPGVEDLAKRLAQQFPSATVWASRVERDPIAYVR